MKRYLAFAGYHSYPNGGWDDFIGDYDSDADALASILDDHENYDWYHVVDSQTKQIVRGNT